MKVKALVAARSGSERVKNKNMRNFYGRTILEYKLEQLKRIDVFDGVVLNSDDDEMLELGKKLGCETVKRDGAFASSSVSMNDVYANMAENFPGDIVVYCNATSPLISDQSIIHAVELYHAHKHEVTSVNSANVVKQFMWLDGKAINYHPAAQPRSQDLPDICALNFAVGVIAREAMIVERTIVSPRCKLFTIPEVEAIDIDTMLDFEVAEYLFSKKIKGEI
ncbi:MAG: acylneuraminate cytidylyltransferase family protein [Defluviitaleaceae bacterium]|nr:acylneuraminate cytidylyltransferase family protein [Defluviitaleaceae bacterium]